MGFKKRVKPLDSPKARGFEVCAGATIGEPYFIPTEGARTPTAVTVHPAVVLTLKACKRARLNNSRKRLGFVLGTVTHHVAWALHNCVVHPIAGVFPIPFVFKLHDFTSKLMGRLS